MPPPGLQGPFFYRHIAGAVSAELVFPTPVVIHSVVVNTAGTSVTLFDTDDPSNVTGRTVASIGAVAGTYEYDLELLRGLVVTTVGSGSDITITYGAAPGNLNLASA